MKNFRDRINLFEAILNENLRGWGLGDQNRHPSVQSSWTVVVMVGVVVLVIGFLFANLKNEQDIAY
ncbi:hypothetical protein T08_13323 [Trichinella sp. T8]|nr:hypothetical protein T08_13323 [Trichinella sp. T8]